MQGQDIRLDCDGVDRRVRVVTLDRPARRNAMSGAMVRALLAMLETAECAEAGAIVLAGAGRGYCAGSDLGELAGMDPHGRAAFEAECGRLARAMSSFPRPIISAVHGFAIGGGLTLAAASDIVVTSGDARWSLPEVPIGLFPAWGLEPVALRIGRVPARRLAWGLDVIDGEAAVRWGLADELADDPLATALALGRKLASLPDRQVASVKEYFAVAREGEEADRHANRLFTAACASTEASASFLRHGART